MLISPVLKDNSKRIANRRLAGPGFAIGATPLMTAAFSFNITPVVPSVDGPRGACENRARPWPPAPTRASCFSSTGDERDLLVRVLEQSATEIRVERRRTETREYHDDLVRQEEWIRKLLAKARTLVN